MLLNILELLDLEGFELIVTRSWYAKFFPHFRWFLGFLEEGGESV